MDQLRSAIAQMIDTTTVELDGLLCQCTERIFKKHEILSRPYIIPQEIYFINRGLIRIMVMDQQSNEHSIHFAMENQFISDYAAFLKKQVSIYTLQAIEETHVTIMPRSAIEWGYSNLEQGEKLGRLIAEYYFIYQDDRIRKTYALTPNQQYEGIAEVFPNIHNRVPQHMIASYLGISPVHLSRLKKSKHLLSSRSTSLS